MPNLTANGNNSIDAKVFANLPKVLAAGASTVVDARGMTILTVITGATSTATVSRVDSDAAVSDAAETAGNASVSTATKLSVTVDHPFYRITAATASVRVACV